MIPFAFDLPKASAAATASAGFFIFSPFASKLAMAQYKKAAQQSLRGFVARTGLFP